MHALLSSARVTMKRLISVRLGLPIVGVLLGLGAATSLGACADNGDAEPNSVADAGGKRRDAGPPKGDDDDDDDTSPGDDAGGEGHDGGGDDDDDAGEVADTGSDAGSATGSVWSTAVADGTIGATEYGGSGNSFTTKGNQTWSIAWDGNNLYLAETNANVNEAVVLYLGFDQNGLSEGQAYDETRPASLPFKANAVIYAKASYNESRTVTAGAWGAPMASTLTFQGSGSTREIVVPWGAVGRALIPSSIRFAAYNVSSTNYVYGQIPEANPGGNIGLNATFTHDYFVASTANGTGSFPFATIE